MTRRQAADRLVFGAFMMGMSAAGVIQASARGDLWWMLVDLLCLSFSASMALRAHRALS